MPETLPSETILSVSISEACQRVGVGQTTMRALLDSGRLPFSRIGLPGKRGRVVIRVSDLDKLLTDTRVAPPLPAPRRAKRARARR